MKTRLAIFILIMLGSIGPTLWAQVPRTLSYQGVLTDTLGVPKADNTYTITFNLYNVATGGTALWSTSKSLTTKQGLFSTTLTVGDTLQFKTQYYLGVKVGADAEMSPRVALSTVGAAIRAIKADTAEYVNGAGVTGINAANITTGAIPSARLSNIVADSIKTGTLSGSRVGSGINAANITTGTLSSLLLSNIVADSIKTGTINNARLDADLQDLADGSLTGSLVGSGINAGNITTGAIPSARLSNIVADSIKTGTLSGARVGSGISAANISGSLSSTQLSNVAAESIKTGTLDNARLDVDLQDLADGSLTGSLVGLGINAANITTGLMSPARLSRGIVADSITTGTLAGARVGTGINAAYITTGALRGAILDTVAADKIKTGTIDNLRLDAELQDLADGSLSGSLVGSGISASNITTGLMSPARLSRGIVADSITSGTLNNSRLPSAIAVTSFTAGAGTSINEFSTDITLGGSSNQAVPTEYAVKTYVDGQTPHTRYWNVAASSYNLPTVTTTPAKIADFTIINKSSASTALEIAFEGFVSVNITAGNGCFFQLRVDSTALDGSYAGLFVVQTASSGSAVRASFSGVKTGLAAGNHTISVWAYMSASGIGTQAYVDQGGWDSRFIIKEVW